MIKEATNWFLSNINFTVVPSINDDLSGDIGLRNNLIYDYNIFNTPGIIVGYSQDNFYYYYDKNIKNLIFILNGKGANPIYSSSKVNSNSLEFINFDLTLYSVGDNINIYNAETLELILQTTISNKANNIISFNDNIIPDINRYKIVNNEGELYCINSIIISSNLVNHKLKIGTLIYANT